MAITYNAGTNTITVTGYTEATPCNFTDIYNADVAGSWGKVTRQCTNQFCINAKIVFGDGSTATWFNDTLKSIILKYDWNLTANATVWFGILEDATDKQTSSGVSFICDHSSEAVIDIKNVGGTLNFYSCSGFGLQSGTNYTKIENAENIYNCIFSYHWQLNKCNGDIYRTNIQKWDTGINACGGSFNDILISDIANYGIIINHQMPASTTMKNIKIRDATYAIRGHLFGALTAQALYLINPDFDIWAFSWYIATNGIVYRQYEFDLKVIDKDNVAINGATVKIWDKDSNLIVDTTTNASGVIATQTITRGYYNQANGNTLQEKSPHLIKIEKAGYTMYEADFTLEAKTDWLIALQTSILRNPSMSGGMV